MKKLDYKVDVTNLYEIYKELLTVKQCDVFERYYYEDESINEIADYYEISKNAVYNSLEKTKKLIYNYESTLHIYYNYEFNTTLLKGYEIDQTIIDQIK